LVPYYATLTVVEALCLTITPATISSIFAPEVLGRAGVLSITVQTLAVLPAAAGRIVLAAFRGDLADIAVF